MKFLSDVAFPSWHGKSVNPNFRQYQSHRNYDQFNCCLEIQSKTDARIYFHLKPFNTTFKSHSYLMSLSRRGSVNPSTSTFPNINPTKTITNLPVAPKICKSPKYGCRNLYYHSFNLQKG